MNSAWKKVILQIAAVAFLGSATSGCYILNFFREDGGSSGGGSATTSETVIGVPLGTLAGSANEAALAAVYEVSSTHAPSAIRPDPDVFVRRLLRQYRDEGATVARQIGEVEQYRLLLGGATEDFSKTPQESYDATSLLAVLKVAEEVCRGLVAPNEWEHPGWNTILPYGADSERENLLWLAQRFIGKPSAEIDETVIDQLLAIMDGEEEFVTAESWANNNAFAKYVPACATLALDAEALYF